MVEINIPGFAPLTVQHLILDFNGTLAVDGRLLPGVEERLVALAKQLQLHVVTADTFGLAAEALRGIPCTLSILAVERQSEAKLAYVHQLGATTCVCIGNGLNDRLMLTEAALGIAVMQEEGAAVATLVAADVATSSISAALDLLINPLRLIATLRA